MLLLGLVGLVVSTNLEAKTTPKHSDTAHPETGSVDGLLNGREVRLLVDTGAQRSCVDAALAMRLGLSAEGSDFLRLPYATGIARTSPT